MGVLKESCAGDEAGQSVVVRRWRSAAPYLKETYLNLKSCQCVEYEKPQYLSEVQKDAPCTTKAVYKQEKGKFKDARMNA